MRMPLFLLIIPVFSTLAGGLLALRFRSSMVFLIALGAGLLLGAAFLDLLPEAITLNGVASDGPANVLALTLASFLVFLLLQTILDSLAPHTASERTLGRISGAMLIFHSLRDGMAIGLSYAASHSAGYAVAAGIAAHDLGDGMNTIILTTGGRKPTLSSYLFLAADSLAPFVGGLLTVWWSFSQRNSVLLLAAAAGFFIHMATSDFLPQIRRPEGASRILLLLSVLLGTALIYAANILTGHLG